MTTPQQDNRTSTVVALIAALGAMITTVGVVLAALITPAGTVLVAILAR